MNRQVLSGGVVALLTFAVIVSLAMGFASPSFFASLLSFFVFLVALYALLRAIMLLFSPNSRDWFKEFWAGKKPEEGKVTAEQFVVEVGHASYYLTDDEQPSDFEKFLDSHVLASGSNEESETPYAFVEHSIIQYALKLEEQHHGALSIQANIKKGSLELGLVFLAQAITYAAMYKDLNESIRLMRSHANVMVDRTREWYHEISGRDINVKTDISSRDIGSISHEIKSLSNVKSPSPNVNTQPFSVTNSVTPPPASNISVTVNTPSTGQQTLGCLASLALFALIVGLVVYLYCYFIDQRMCLDSTRIIIEWLSAAAIDLGDFLIAFGNEIRPN